MFFMNPEGFYPLHIGDVQLVKPDYKIGQPLPLGWREVHQAQPPIIAEDEAWENSDPVEIDGQLFQGYTIRKLTDEELEKRNQLLNDGLVM